MPMEETPETPASIARPASHVRDHIRASWLLDDHPATVCSEPAFYWRYMDTISPRMPGWALHPTIWTPTPLDARPCSPLLCGTWFCLREESGIVGSRGEIDIKTS
jgi:hypothetical protein